MSIKDKIQLAQSTAEKPLPNSIVSVSSAQAMADFPNAIPTAWVVVRQKQNDKYSYKVSIVI